MPSSGPPKQRRRFSFRPSGGRPADIPQHELSQEKVRATERVCSDQSMRTLVAQWDKKIAKVIESRGMGEHVEDIKQEVYAFICRRDADGRNGLEKYDPEKGAFSTYLYKAVNTAAFNYKEKLKRKASLVALMPTERGLELASDRGLSHRPFDGANFWLAVERIDDELDAKFEGHGESFFADDDELVTRDLRTLLELLLEGKTAREIAEYWRCKEGDVDLLMVELRASRELRELLGHDDE